MAQSYFTDFIEYVQSINIAELDSTLIDRSDVGYQRYLGDMLLRIAYHDAMQVNFTIFTNDKLRKTINLGLNTKNVYTAFKLALQQEFFNKKQSQNHDNHLY